MLAEKVNSWRKRFRQYYFTYSQGFYHLPYNGSSPQTLVDSFDKFPFVKHSREKQCISSNNPVCEGGFYYHKLEEGCWIVYSKMRYKTNVAYDLAYDDRDDESTGMTPDDYYMLSLNNINNTVEVSKSICEKQLCFPQYSWTFFKPRERHCDLNFKGANNRYITLYFNEEWLRKNLMPHSLFTESKLDCFINSERRYIVWALSGKDEVMKNFELFDKVMNIGGDVQQIEWLDLKFSTLALIFDLLKLCKEQNIAENCLQIEYDGKFRMNQVEHYLGKHLLDKFPGIELLASKFNVSETKLKTEFKQLFGEPVYHYFKERQMQLAKELLTENQLIIKEISYKLGYENTSKFSAAFKKHHGILPSELRKT
jgi:AraC-like DNA-binding protein